MMIAHPSSTLVYQQTWFQVVPLVRRLSLDIRKRVRVGKIFGGKRDECKQSLFL
jgi:hypothetical protein